MRQQRLPACVDHGDWTEFSTGRMPVLLLGWTLNSIVVRIPRKRVNQGMIKRAPLYCFIAFLFSLSGFAAEKPNILFIFADDQCYETIAALGYTDIDTPNLDRLANQGTAFTQTYNMGGWHGAICVASRTMINTGRFLWRARDLEPKLSLSLIHI